MAQVNVSIHGKSYGIACDEGQQHRVAALGRYVDQRLRDLARAGGASSESHLLVLTTLLLADEIFDLREHAATMEEEQEASRYILENQEISIQTVEKLAERIDMIADRIGKV